MNADLARHRAEKCFKPDTHPPGGQERLLDYEARALAIRAKTERLRALRLAKEALEKNSRG